MEDVLLLHSGPITLYYILIFGKCCGIVCLYVGAPMENPGAAPYQIH